MANFRPSSGLFLTALLISCVFPTTGNRGQPKGGAKKGIGGAKNESQVKPEQNDKLAGLKNYTNTIDWTQQNDEVKQVIAGLLQGVNMDALLSLVGGGFGNIFSGNSSFIDSMKEVFNSSKVQERIYAMKVMVDSLIEESVDELKISESCYSEVKTMLEGLLGGKDWALRSKFILKLKIKRNDWLLADTCPQAANHYALNLQDLLFILLINIKCQQFRINTMLS